MQIQGQRGGNGPVNGIPNPMQLNSLQQRRHPPLATAMLLRKHLLPLLRAASPIHHRACPLLSTSASASPTATPFSLEDYLVAACGLAPAQARKAAQKAFDGASRNTRKAFEEISNCRLNSASNPDAILSLLSSAGLSRADIATVVAADPLLLRATPHKFGPRLFALRDRFGLSAPQILRFLLVGSRSLRNCDVIPRLQFWISFYGSFERVLMAVKGNGHILEVSLERVIEPNIALLRQFGVRDIAQLCSNSRRLLTSSLESLKDFLLRAEELGVPRTSRMFKYAVALVAGNSKEKVAAKLDFFKRTFGCSESEVSIATSKMPSILGISDEKFTRKIEFLVNEVGMEPQCILQRPVLLAYSLEKRLIPRHRVMKALQAKGLFNGNTYSTLANMGEGTFVLKFIDSHEDSVPGLAAYYAKACAGDMPP